MTSLINAGLLNLNISHYVIQEDWWGLGSGDIFSKEGKTIGTMKRDILSLRAFTEVKEVNDSVVFTVNRKIISLRPSYILKDSRDNVIGRTNKKIMSLFRPKLWLEDAKGKKQLEAQGNFLGRDFKITDNKKRFIAQIKKTDFFGDLILGGTLFDFSDTYIVNIVDKAYDRRLVLGFVIAIDNSLHDGKKKSISRLFRR